jgi:hypothetical protein
MSFKQNLFLSTCVFLFSQLTLAILLWLTGGNYFDPESWIRYDSEHYLSIAGQGYTLYQCSDDSASWCGNAGWFPGYPALIRIFSFLADIKIAAVFISRIFYFCTIMLMIRLAGFKSINRESVLFSLCPAFFFGFIYYNAVFPLSATVFLIISSMHFYQKRNFIACGLCCMIATVFYPTAFLSAIVYGLNWLTGKQQSRNLAAMVFPIAGALIGSALVFLIYHHTTGHALAYYHVQEKYGHHFSLPFKNMSEWFLHSPYLVKNEVRIFIYIQALLMLLFAAILTFFFFKRRKNDPLTRWAFIYMLVYFLFYWSIAGNLSMYRSDALLLPALLIMKDENPKLIALLFAFLFSLGLAMSWLFFDKVLV